MRNPIRPECTRGAAVLSHVPLTRARPIAQSCGAKWMTKHPTKLAAAMERFPHLKESFAKLGLDPAMDTTTLLDHIKGACVLDKKAAKKVLAAVGDGEMEDAAAKMTKPCITL